MPANLIAAILLLVAAIIGVLGLRRFPERLRIGFDVVGFFAISFYLWKQGTLPIFPPLGSMTNGAALGLRAAGGAWWLLASRLLVSGLWSVHRRDIRSHGTHLFLDLSEAAIYVATGAIVLNSVFALPVAGIVATSGVVAIVLGLALQNTLSDVFSGIAVGIEMPFQVGDRIQIGERIEGQVVQVNWRSIRIQTDGDDTAIVPNSLIAKSEIINRSRPTLRRTGSVELSCPNHVPPETVIETLLDATLLCPDILRSPAPRAMLTRLGPKRGTYRISFLVESTERLSSTMDLLLRGARRQLHYAGLLAASTMLRPGSASRRDTALYRQLLEDATVFECLTDVQLDKIATQLKIIRLEPGETLFAQGSTGSALHIVVSGVLRVTRQLGPLCDTLGYIGAGEYIGEISMLTGAERAATAAAETHCRLCEIDRDVIAPLLAENSQLAVAFDKSVRHGLEILHRSIAARAAPTMGPQGQLLQKIRNIFHSRSV